MGENAEIFERLSRIEQIVARIDERTKAHDSAHSDHETRIRSLERMRQAQGRDCRSLVFLVRRRRNPHVAVQGRLRRGQLMSGIRFSGVDLPIYQGVMGNSHVVVVDWHCDVTLPDGRAFCIRVRHGFIFDGASIPRLLWRVCGHPMEVPRVVAALAHDWLYASHAVDRATADAIYREICRMVGVGWLRRSVEYRALRLFGGAAWWSHGPEDINFARSHGAIELKGKENNR